MIFAPDARFTSPRTAEKPTFMGAPMVAVEWLWVSSPYATFGLGLAVDGTVVEAAECAAWLIGADEDEARDLLRAEDPDVLIVAFPASTAS